MGRADFRHPDRAGPGRLELLKYIADLIHVMQQMAAREGCEELSQLLNLCLAEAIREARQDTLVEERA
jgi:hypothetical protein